jgi:hypothetical protein
VVSWLYNLLNIGVSMVDYYMAAILIDHKLYGRKWMQANGFVADFIIAAVQYKGEAAGVHDRMHRGRTVCLAARATTTAWPSTSAT